jgi:transposase
VVYLAAMLVAIALPGAAKTHERAISDAQGRTAALAYLDALADADAPRACQLLTREKQTGCVPRFRRTFASSAFRTIDQRRYRTARIDKVWLFNREHPPRVVVVLRLRPHPNRHEDWALWFVREAGRLKLADDRG